MEKKQHHNQQQKQENNEETESPLRYLTKLIAPKETSIIVGSSFPAFVLNKDMTLSEYDCAEKVYADAKYFMSTQNYDEAIKLFNIALRLEKNEKQKAKIYKNKGDALYEMRFYEQSIECYNQSIKLDVNYIEAFNNKGDTLLKLELYKEATQCFDTLLELNPNDVDGHFNR